MVDALFLSLFSCLSKLIFVPKKKNIIKKSRKVLDDNEKRRNWKKKTSLFVVNEIKFRQKELLFLIQYEHKLFIREIRWSNK